MNYYRRWDSGISTASNNNLTFARSSHAYSTLSV
jgi:hypothetical protein